MQNNDPNTPAGEGGRPQQPWPGQGVPPGGQPPQGRTAAGVKTGPAGQRGKARLHVGGDEVTHLAIDGVEPAHGVEQAALFLVKLAHGAEFDAVAQIHLAIGAGKDALKVEGGKRLPLPFEKGKHLPERFAKWVLGGHPRILNKKPEAIIASAILAGTSG